MVYNIEEIKQKLESIFNNYDVTRAILFGSYAKNMADINSDIDIAIETSLGGLKFIGLVEQIRETMQKEVDVIGMRYIEKDSKIEREIKETGVEIYGG